MIVHNVFFWLKKDLSGDDVQTFKAALLALKDLDCVKNFYLGAPAPTQRPVVDSSYSYCLTTVFEDMVGHDEYQIHPVHKAFLSENSMKWDKVLIYDSQEN